MTDEKEPIRKIHFSKQVFDTLANADQELGKKLGAALRDIMENPTAETSTRRKATSTIREEDREKFSKLIGGRIVGHYTVIEPHPPFFHDSFCMSFMYVGRNFLMLQGVEEESLKKLGIPKANPVSPEGVNQLLKGQNLTLIKFEEAGEGVKATIKKEDERPQEVYAKYYSLSPIPNPQAK